jgi:2-polyprenyl-6-methoxyphenol hydroxylase-like FAD-dependent oxidoreductase
MIDFFGPGFDVAERLGLLPALEGIHYPVEKLVFVGSSGRARAELEYRRLRAYMFRDRHFNFMRGELEQVLFGHLPDSVELRFGVSPLAFRPDRDGVVVATSDGRSERFDLVVGADGVHSATRGLAFPPGSAKETRLGCHTAAFVLAGQPRRLESDAFVTLSDADISAAAYPIRGDRTATFFLYRAGHAIEDRSAKACRLQLEAAFRGCGWITDQLLDAFPDAKGGLYFDDVTQIQLDRWSRGRVALIGDACGAVSLLAGQGASMAMAGAYILAQELERSHGEIEAAFARYEARVRPAVEVRQRSAHRNAGWFLAKSHFRAVLRDRVTDWFVRSPAVRLFGPWLAGDPLSLSP